MSFYVKYINIPYNVLKLKLLKTCFEWFQLQSTAAEFQIFFSYVLKHAVRYFHLGFPYENCQKWVKCEKDEDCNGGTCFPYFYSKLCNCDIIIPTTTKPPNTITTESIFQNSCEYLGSCKCEKMAKCETDADCHGGNCYKNKYLPFWNKKCNCDIVKNCEHFSQCETDSDCYGGECYNNVFLPKWHKKCNCHAVKTTQIPRITTTSNVEITCKQFAICETDSNCHGGKCKLISFLPHTVHAPIDTTN